ncbi:restriction endonuclease [Marinicauda salina]|uniref:Restriction endonuclease n=1 Tax=Marinicauda salina TaxID=2135793 RepID=A0A2U2BVP0_9PROT|nr:phospholipase D-like domain-containing protein [Marinicauda salina]PWE18083.1 restriction endonuclease [Marinicauda salina]
MVELTLHPNVYATGGSTGLVPLLERVWIRDHEPGAGTFYIISGFGNYNGGVRFYPTFRRHIDAGGRVVAFFGGSTRQRLTSKQLVKELLECGAEVHVINRKRLMHAKSYGFGSQNSDSVIVTSGNFTGPGMSQNVEMAVLIDEATSQTAGFSWEAMIGRMLDQSWDIYRPPLGDEQDPAWELLYDEQGREIVLDETDEVTMLLRLGHADTARIMADPGTKASKGTQYFWLSRDCYDFFPPLTILNQRGIKRTYSCLINMTFVDLGVRSEVRVTFEAENNLDFRLGTGPLRATKLAGPGDLALISRVGEREYELRLIQSDSAIFPLLDRYAVHVIGHQGKQYGYLSNETLGDILGYRIGRTRH